MAIIVKIGNADTGKPNIVIINISDIVPPPIGTAVTSNVARRAIPNIFSEEIQCEVLEGIPDFSYEGNDKKLAINELETKINNFIFEKVEDKKEEQPIKRKEVNLSEY